MESSIILYEVLPNDLLHCLEEHFTVTQVPNLHPGTVVQHTDAFTNAGGLLGSSEAVNTTLLGKIPRLRATSTISVGYDNFDIDALNARKILSMRTPTMLTETITSTVMALVLSTACRIMEAAERVKVGGWTKSIEPDWFGTDVYHKTLGIVGMGRIGLTLAQRVHFGLSIPILYNAHRHYQEVEEHFSAHYCDFDTLLQESDLVCLILPLTDETHHLFSTEQFAKMKSSAIFTDIGCDPVVDERALIAALQKGETRVTSLDVFEQKPLSAGSPLLSLPNMVTVLHIGSATHETRYNMATCTMDNLVDALQGHVERNCVNPRVAP